VDTPFRQLASDGLVALFIAVLSGCLGLSGHLLSSRASAGLESLLGLGASMTGLALAMWWLLSACLAVASALLTAAGRHASARCAGALAPAFMRRLALAVLGMSLIAAPSAHAASGPFDPAWQAAAPEASASPPPTPLVQPPTNPAAGESMELAWTPALPPPPTGPLVQAEKRAAATPAQTVEVRPGDSLWSVTARHLGPGATEIQIAEAWPKWFEANRAVIGDNPDVIRPGQLLSPPQH
jgi:hypothetical protein